MDTANTTYDELVLDLVGKGGAPRNERWAMLLDDKGTRQWVGIHAWLCETWLNTSEKELIILEVLVRVED